MFLVALHGTDLEPAPFFALRIHAKAAVEGTRYARIGSTNLNLASWLGNCELDVFVEDERFAAQVAEMYEQDLQHATEIVLTKEKHVRSTNSP